MSDTLIAKELRARFKAEIADANIITGGMAVKNLKTLPDGFVVKDTELPAFYVFSSGETLEYGALDEVDRTLFLDVVIMAMPGGDPMDQLDDIQLAIEQAQIAADGFGLARSNRLMSTEIAQFRGALVIGSRVMKYEIKFGVTPLDPSL